METLPESSGADVYKFESKEYPTETFLIDESTGCIKKVGGGLPAMKQAIDIILNVERYQYQIYTSNFGRELNKLIGKPPEYVTSMLKRRIREAFSMDSRILSVDNFVFDINLGIVKSTFDVKTVFGTIPGEVEV
ncbi:DUF2634 domain-containing protein [Lacrimispora sp.]|uniref:DUF2634 domain-containing protein n=1 Tax=Lacrimispora sp. TaxID=2719234 RepID=UPI00285EB945|nr:DUF2634 domain-containing protein [Lacrimispora sp.]MDR7813393.1 DUF2634 domain-containing protein [Lacrimispora sp.]